MCYNVHIKPKEMSPLYTKYIKPKNAWKKLTAAYDIMQPVCICGATGFGKTELAKRFLGKKPYDRISCAECPDIDTDAFPASGIAVIDDLHMLSDSEKQTRIAKLLNKGNSWIILLCRSKIPSWLMQSCIELGMMIISENDLRLSPADMFGYFSEMGIDISPDEVSALCRKCDGNALIIKYCAAKLAEGMHLGDELDREVMTHFMEYLNVAVIPGWDTAVTDLLMKMSVVDSFTVPMAEKITGDPYAFRILKQAEECGNFIERQGDTLVIRKILLMALRERAVRTFGTEKYNSLMLKAGVWYEANGRDGEAFEIYKKCGSYGHIRDLLISNARKHIGVGYYFEMRKYYFQLDEADIEKSPVLMSAMSMLYSSMMDGEKAEYWYGRLKEYSKKAVGTERREAMSRLVYLDIGLPHRGIAGVLDVIKSVPLLFDKGIGLPEFSVTSNMPSVMNGGKDFCEWSLKDRELARTVGKLVERVLGAYGKGLCSVSLGESLYEKAEDNYEVLSLLSKAQIESGTGGRLEITFASVGLQARMLAQEGNADAARSILESFEKKAAEENSVKLLPNIEAMKCRTDLMTGNTEAVRRWFEKAPDENTDFNVLERYLYLTKIRCYITFGEYTAAYALAEKMRYYAEKCGRTYISIELNILTAVLKRRSGSSWQENFRKALTAACRYGFVRVISEESSAAAELFDGVKNEIKDWGLDSGWLEKTAAMTKRAAVYYPAYLKGQHAAAADFSKLDLDILRMQADGYSVPEIAKMLEINSRTVKYHVQENYRRLGASGKAEAVLTARNLKLL